VATELKTIYDSLTISNYRYAINVPITPEEQKLFNNSVKDIEAEADQIIDYIETHLDDPSWWCSDFVKKGIIPTLIFKDTIQNYRVN
jgi:hypothetical protein